MSRASKEKQQWDRKRNMGSVGTIDGSANLETALSSPAAMLSGTTFNLVFDTHVTNGWNIQEHVAKSVKSW